VPDDIDELALFDDGYQSDPEDAEPVFWSYTAIKGFPQDDFIRYVPAEIS
jgi:hypothetical protein